MCEEKSLGMRLRNRGDHSTCIHIIIIILQCTKNYYLPKNGRKKKKNMEDPGIDPGTSRMLSERSTI